MKPLLITSGAALLAALAYPVAAQTSDAGNPAQSREACAQNWTIVDSNKSGTISEAEANAATEADFTRIDVNGDGSVSVTEWKDCGDPTAYPGNAGADPVPAGNPAETTAEDPQGPKTQATGQVSPASEQAAADLTVQPPETENSAVAELTGRTGLPWNEDDFPSALDADKSGDISAEEAAQAERSAAGQAEPDEAAVRRLGGTFARVDANGDGKLSTEEWSNRNSQTFNGLFGRIDADGNDEISRDEWRLYRTEGYTRAATTGGGQEPTIWQYYYFVVG